MPARTGVSVRQARARSGAPALKPAAPALHRSRRPSFQCLLADLHGNIFGCGERACPLDQADELRALAPWVGTDRSLCRRGDVVPTPLADLLATAQGVGEGCNRAGEAHRSTG